MEKECKHNHKYTKSSDTYQDSQGNLWYDESEICSDCNRVLSTYPIMISPAPRSE